ncbi:hypothetical protein BUQ74_17100 [Leptospira weilii serovar Heyan]|nr:hypothetical protein BUQ74_17100 [Leptospira weilii serovar Heyan]
MFLREVMLFTCKKYEFLIEKNLPIFPAAARARARRETKVQCFRRVKKREFGVTKCESDCSIMLRP